MSKKEELVLNAEVIEGHFDSPEVVEKLTNSALKKQVKVYAKAVSSTKANLWAMAKAVAVIMEMEHFKDDFATEGQFAEFMGMSQAKLSKMKRLGSMTVGDASLEQLGYSTAQAEEMLKIDKRGEMEDFFNSALHPDPKMTRDDVRACVKAYIDASDQIKLEDKEAEEETEYDQNEDGYMPDDMEEVEEGYKDYYTYLLPVMEGDGVEEEMVRFLNYDSMERVAKAIKKALDIEIKKGLVEDAS